MNYYCLLNMQTKTFLFDDCIMYKYIFQYNFETQIFTLIIAKKHKNKMDLLGEVLPYIMIIFQIICVLD